MWCDALIGRFFEHDAWYCEEKIVGEIEWQLDAEAKNMLAEATRQWVVWKARSWSESEKRNLVENA